jgi:hypothetical protein
MQVKKKKEKKKGDRETANHQSSWLNKEAISFRFSCSSPKARHGSSIKMKRNITQQEHTKGHEV